MRLVENAVVAGRFRLNHVLGRGGMGAVWHATHLGLDIPCAIKFVKGELVDQEDMRNRFEREAKAAAHLRSPHVVQILDHGVCEGTPYIAMELLDGEDLGSRLQKRGRLTPEELHKIMSEACRALAKAHAQGIVHRDLKPDNIFLVRDDDREITKVLDFGIAKTSTNELGGSGTKTGAMLGTPYYMSPEQAQGTKAVDFRSDLWSLAVIAYQCLTGVLPFESEALGDLLVKIIISPIPVPSLVAPVPAGFDRWWAKAASRDPAERFQSAKEFSDALALVCGVSHVSGVIDRGQLRVVAEGSDETGRRAPLDGALAASALAQAQQQGGRAATPEPYFGTPPANARPGSSPSVPNQRAASPSASFPAAGVAAMSTGSRTAAIAPLAASSGGSSGATGAPALSASGATPTPLSRSFVDGAAPKASSRVGLIVALAFGGLLTVGALGIGGWFLFGDHRTGTAASPSTSSSSASPATPATSAARASADVPPPPPPVAPASAQASAAPSPPAAPPPPPADTPAAATDNNGAAPPSSAGGSTGTATSNGSSSSGGSSGSSRGKTPKSGAGGTPTKPKPGKPADMGF